MTSVSLVGSPSKPAARDLAVRAIEWLGRRGITTGVSSELAAALGRSELSQTGVAFQNSDLIVALGGDGTILHAARLVAPHETPVLGVNSGRFGFIAAAQPHELEEGLTAFLEGRHLIEQRMMIACATSPRAPDVADGFALNEFSIHRKAEGSMIEISISIDGHQVVSYAADGIIVATPTGSTAYNLSSGGPVVEPTMLGMVLTAISPHTLSNRPLVTRPEAKITLTLQSQADALLLADGHAQAVLTKGDSVSVCRAPFSTRLVTFRPDDFFTKLGKRLFYGARSTNDVGFDG